MFEKELKMIESMKGSTTKIRKEIADSNSWSSTPEKHEDLKLNGSKTTERDRLLEILRRIGQTVLYEDDKSIEFENQYGPEQICVEFDSEGNIVLIGS